MTDKTTEALKLAEKALVEADRYYDYDDVLAAIRTCLEQVSEVSQETEAEALAEQETQKPVAVISEAALGHVKLHSNGVSLPFGTPLYAAPVSVPKQEPVAWHDKIKGMEVSVDVSTGEDDDYYRVFGRVDGVMLESCGAQNDIILVIEESRNFAAPVSAPKQEPIGYVFVEYDENYTGSMIYANKSGGDMLPVYLAPVSAKREWVELTDDDYERLLKTCRIFKHQARAAIAAFKEKNK